MGVGGGFWEILRPIAQQKDLEWLKGKRVAIDLSFWIVQQQKATKGLVRKPHLRLLFYRIINLIAKVGALPIFVVDGDPPPLKLQTRQQRLSRMLWIPVEVIGEEGRDNSCKSAFVQSIEECVELIRLLGIPVLRAKYEAERLCAELDSEGFVDACVTPDSDAFLYGAKRVVKILQVDFKKPKVELYTSSDIQSVFGLEREDLIALALLVGCDYNTEGVPGIGCRNAMRLIRMMPKHDVLNWLQKQQPQEQFPENYSRGSFIEKHKYLQTEDLGTSSHLPMKKIYHCSYCGHPGTKKVHLQNGCKDCMEYNEEGAYNCACQRKTTGFKCSCIACMEKRGREVKIREEVWFTKICSKIAATKSFPDEQIIKIYLNSEHTNFQEGGQNLQCLSWKPPHIDEIESFLAEHLYWDKYYIRKKMLPILSRYSLQERAASNETRNINPAGLLCGIYSPHSIRRIKSFYSRSFYTVRWGPIEAGVQDWLGLMEHTDIDETRPGLNTDTLYGQIFFLTDEDIDLVGDACPELVKEFNQKKEGKVQKIEQQSSKRKKDEFLPCGNMKRDGSVQEEVEKDKALVAGSIIEKKIRTNITNINEELYSGNL